MNRLLTSPDTAFSPASPSPFHLRTDWGIRIENHNKNCTHSQIDALIMKNLVTPTDLGIMKLLACYRYINSYNLSFGLTLSLPSAYRKASYQRNIKKLVHAGILLKHCLCCRLKDGRFAGTVSPMRFYCLSPGAYSYTAPLVPRPHGLTCGLPDHRIMEQLAVSQVLIHLTDSCKNKGYTCRTFCNVNRRTGNHSFFLDAVIHLTSSAASWPPRCFFLLCGRLCDPGHQSLLSRASFLRRWLARHADPLYTYAVIYLLESLEEIYTCGRFLADNGPADEACPQYYALDTDQLVYPLFDSLYAFSPGQLQGTGAVNRVTLDL